MFNVCLRCGMYAVKKEIRESRALCPFCGWAEPFLQLPLFILTGASGAGKTTICRVLSRMTDRVVVLESDILWDKRFNTPEDHYRTYRELWLRLCKNISQGGKPCLLCGCAEPSQLENCDERRYFGEIHYLALVAQPAAIRARLEARPHWRESGGEDFVRSQLAYNQWFWDRHLQTSPPMTLLDNTGLSEEAAARQVLCWLEKLLP